MWEVWVEEALQKLEKLRRVGTLIAMQSPSNRYDSTSKDGMKFYEEAGPWDRLSVEFQVEDGHNFILFSGNDYLGLSSHPSVRAAAAQAAQECGMGPRGSALICGYTNHHRMLESALAHLKNKEVSLLCPSGFAANMAVLSAIGSISSLLSTNGKKTDDHKIAIFSDALNHASIIDGIHLTERLGDAKSFVYKHCDMVHLEQLLLHCKIKKKVVVTDSLFSMDGDFAPLTDLASLRKKHGFLLVIDDAHGTLVCGKDGGGVAEMFHVEKDIDICVGTLSKAVGCNGGFIASSKKWKTLVQSRGRSFIFSTALSIPEVAAAHAAIIVAQEEKWRQKALWQRIQELGNATGLKICSPIIPWVIGNEEDALMASRLLMDFGYHVTAITPPAVPANSCRLRITLSAAHTTMDVRALAAALGQLMTLMRFGVESALSTTESCQSSKSNRLIADQKRSRL